MIERVYLASWFASRDEMNKRADDLKKLNIEMTARWVLETINKNAQTEDVPEHYLRETARVDIEDILSADTVILNVPAPEDLATCPINLATWARGGRHFEAGFQYALMMFWHYLPADIKNRGERRLILIGHRENVFHFLDGMEELHAEGISLPSIEMFETWEDALRYLKVHHSS